MEVKLNNLLKKYWGHSQFRPMQQDIIQTVIAGKDVLAILPTGGGKSVCYQLPAIVLGGTCLVISALIALMQDQVFHLKRKGISAACIHSGMQKKAIGDILNKAIEGELHLLYVSPERLQSEDFLHILSLMTITMVAVDEAHCISQWGHDFRPAYLEIAKMRPYLTKGIPWMAVTATATPKVQEEIVHYLGLKQPELFRKSVYRENLIYQVLETESKPTEVISLFKNNKGSGILYINSRRKCMEMREWLKISGIKSLAYHAGLAYAEREIVQSDWTRSHETVMCATSAFGMGIDKGDVSIVVHLSPPDSLEAYYQEAGRAGRDGQPAKCVLLYSPFDITRLEEAPAIHYPSRKFVHQVYQFLNDFLQIPLGSGQEEAFPFDVLKFVKNFNLPLMPTISAIRILAKEGYWIWEEQSHQPSLIRVLVSDEEIRHSYHLEPQAIEVLTAILRLHSGVFHFPVRLKLWDLTKYLNIEQSLIFYHLKKMDTMGLIDYQAGDSVDFLYFLHNRFQTKDLYLDVERIKRLKKAYQDRIASMLAYLSNETICRSQLLSEYFGEKEIVPCEKCDFCEENERGYFSAATVRGKIREKLLIGSENNLQNLSSHFPGLPNGALIEQLRILQDEGFCRVTPNGTIILK